MESPLNLSVPARLNIPRYRIVREIGRGAMGVVYEAEHAVLARRVALKLLHPDLRDNSIATARFLREGRFAAHLHHPHLVEVLDAGTCDAGPFLVMEYVDGPTLATHLRESGAIAPERVVELVLPIASALMHAHATGVVHRDLKPANILLARDRFGDLLPKIGDFGLGKWLEGSGDRSLTRDGIVGSLPYMSPEQVREAKAVDARADQYSLAVLIYEAVAGRLPFDAKGAFELMEAICAGRTTSLAKTAAGVPAAFAEVIHRAMSLRVEDRYPSVAAMGRALVRFSSGRSWNMWAREFAAPSAHPIGDTFNDAISLAADARVAARWKLASKPILVRALIPVICFGLGVSVTSAALRARRVAVQPAPAAESESATPRMISRPVESLSAFDERFEPYSPVSSVIETPHVPRSAAPPLPGVQVHRGPEHPSPSSSPPPNGRLEFGANNAPLIE